MNFLLMIVAYVIIYAACDYKRTEESKIKFMSKEWFIQVAMVTAGGVMLNSL